MPLEYPTFFLFAKIYECFFLDKILTIKRRITPVVTDVSAILKTAKYFTDIISVTAPNILRSMALREPQMNISKYPIFSISDNFFQEIIINHRSPDKIIGIMKCMPGRGVLNAIPVFLKSTIFIQSPINDILGICICAQYFERISDMMIKNEMRYIFILV